jgi:uncharacterized membrane protein HdeD (DUF308 family)
MRTRWVPVIVGVAAARGRPGGEVSNAPPWKVALVGAVALAAAGALLTVEWTLLQLAAFVAMLFIARGALHVVTTSFEGMAGALSALLGVGELAVGLVLLVWPSPTVLVITVVVGVWAIARAVTLGTNILATRRELRPWRILLVPAVLELVAGVALFATTAGSVGRVALIIGSLMVLDGVTELMLAVDGRRRGTHTHVPVPTS